MKSRRSCAAVALAIALALTGCSSDDGPDAADPSSSSGGSPSPSASDSSAAPTVEAATGLQLSSDQLTAHLPADEEWEVGNGGRSGYLDLDPSEPPSDIRLGGSGRGATDLDALAAVVLQGEKDSRPSARREDNRTVAGLEGFVVTVEDGDGYHYEFGTISDGYHASVVFDLPRNDAAAHELIDAVLASVEWK